jgi:glycosyltransferase involved in cell wall biosynthesis
MTAGHAPRVSIGLPVYNGERWLAESVDSLSAHTFTDIELIICDNATTDGTEAICRRYSEQDSRMRYSRNAENIGPGRMAWSRPELAESGRPSFPQWLQPWGFTTTVRRAS